MVGVVPDTIAAVLSAVVVILCGECGSVCTVVSNGNGNGGIHTNDLRLVLDVIQSRRPSNACTTI